MGVQRYLYIYIYKYTCFPHIKNLSTFIYIYIYIYIYIFIYIRLINIYRYYTCMYVYVYNIYYICNKYRERTDRQLATYNDIHMFPLYPNFIHFEKLLLHNKSKECAFSPTFKCIHQLCLLSGRKGKLKLAWGRIFSFCTLYLKNIFHLRCRPIEYQH